MTISQQVLLRYRDEGHLRFDLPAELSAREASQALVQGLHAREGIYRVSLSGGGRKLAIRFLSTVCDFREVIRHLHGVIQGLREQLPQPTPRAVIPHPSVKAVGQVLESRRTALARWLREKLQEVRETVEAMKIMAGRFLGMSGNGAVQRPRWIKEFLNDLLMLYLIKLHWHHIVSEWIPRPWTYRYEWAATIYLIYLSVQSRLPQHA